jgi:hypothetical protein
MGNFSLSTSSCFIQFINSITSILFTSFCTQSSKDSWVNANYGTGDADAEPSYNTTSEEGGATNTTDLYTDNITESAEPTPSPVGDPFGWVSSGSFSGESYDAGDSESWWGSSGRSSGGNGMSSYYFIIAGLLYLVL